MKEYIEREKLIDDILHALLVVPSEDFLLPPEKDIVRMIKSEPAADVRKVVRGRWITKPYMMGNTQYCSRCGENYGMKHNFCPNCGADMRGDDYV